MQSNQHMLKTGGISLFVLLSFFYGIYSFGDQHYPLIQEVKGVKIALLNCTYVATGLGASSREIRFEFRGKSENFHVRGRHARAIERYSGN